MTKNINKIFSVLILLAIVFLCIIGYNLQKETQQVNHVLANAKTDEYTSVSDIEKASDIIVYGEKIQEDYPTVERDENGNLLSIYTMSTFKISQIDKTNGEIKNNDNIKILENQGYDEETNTTYHIAGYEKMQTGHKYLMLLRKADGDINGNEYYIPIGVNYGKIPADKNENIIFKTSENLKEATIIKELTKKVGEKYGIY